MPKIHIEADIPLATLVHTAAQLNTEDLRAFTAQLLALSAQRTASSVPQEEAELLLGIHRRFPEKMQQYYETLLQKRNLETLSEAEYEELSQLTQQSEACDVARVEALTQLAALRGVTVPMLMTHPDLQPVEQRVLGYCEYCQSQPRYSKFLFSLSYILPRSQGGVTHLDNLALACQGCNNRKYKKMHVQKPVPRQLVALFHPRQQHWWEHFAWDERFETVLGLTAVGWATVEALQLNRPELQQLRRLLYAAGEHPSVALAEMMLD